MESWLKVCTGLCLAGLLVGVKRVASRLRERGDGSVNQLSNEKAALRIIRPLLAVGFYAALLDWLLPGTRLAWSYHALPSQLRLLAAAGCAFAVAIVWWSFETLGHNYRGGVGLWDDHQLLTSGPYAWVRHPIYSAFVLIMISLWMMSANWILGSTGVALTLAIPALRLRTEERQLAERFGARYTAWVESTRRFIPWLL